jgi:hypothetical protein
VVKSVFGGVASGSQERQTPDEKKKLPFQGFVVSVEKYPMRKNRRDAGFGIERMG